MKSEFRACLTCSPAHALTRAPSRFLISRLAPLHFHLVLLTYLTLATLSAAPYSPPLTHRADLSLNSGWRFIRQDVAGAQTNGFDDSSWSPINLPHTWNNLDGQDGGNNYYRGIGWYRSHYTVDNGYAGRRFFLNFDGASSVA